MEYITSKEAAEKWGVSERMVRVYCVQERIPNAYQEFEIWYIPENAAKPTRKKKEASQLPKLLKTLIKQREAQIALQGLLECQSQQMRAYHKGGNR